MNLAQYVDYVHVLYAENVKRIVTHIKIMSMDFVEGKTHNNSYIVDTNKHIHGERSQVPHEVNTFSKFKAHTYFVLTCCVTNFVSV